MVDLAGLRLDRDSVARFKGYIIGLLSLLVGVSIFLLFNIVRLNRMRLKVQKGKRVPTVEGGASQGFLTEGQAGGMDGTFDVGAPQQRQR
jgi:hypothetical protein